MYSLQSLREIRAMKYYMANPRVGTGTLPRRKARLVTRITLDFKTGKMTVREFRRPKA